ncbi:MAG: 5-bromo-4-chloroindolyl phosphate hydrolysis family protein [Ignavibacteriales bacterium]
MAKLLVVLFFCALMLLVFTFPILLADPEGFIDFIAWIFKGLTWPIRFIINRIRCLFNWLKGKIEKIRLLLAWRKIEGSYKSMWNEYYMQKGGGIFSEEEPSKAKKKDASQPAVVKDYLSKVDADIDSIQKCKEIVGNLEIVDSLDNIAQLTEKISAYIRLYPQNLEMVSNIPVYLKSVISLAVNYAEIQTSGMSDQQIHNTALKGLNDFKSVLQQKLESMQNPAVFNLNVEARMLSQAKEN